MLIQCSRAFLFCSGEDGIVAGKAETDYVDYYGTQQHDRIQWDNEYECTILKEGIMKSLENRIPFRSLSGANEIIMSVYFLGVNLHGSHS